MINLIIFEKNEVLKNKIKNTIYKCFGSKDDDFKITNYEKTKIDKNQKIYILSSNEFNEAIGITKKIRNSGDFNSPIIIISNIKKEELNNNLLVLSYINKDESMNTELTSALNKAYNILIDCNTFNFTYKRVIYRIPLNDILYIEKEVNSNISIIHTKNTTYKLNNPIKEIEKEITCASFMKVHRSCIVNLNNVKKYDFTENLIYFEKEKTNLICREKRNILKEKLLLLNNHNQ